MADTVLVTGAAGFIGSHVAEHCARQGMTIFGDGTQTRAFSRIDDVAPIIAKGPLVPAAYNEVFNVGADQPYSVNELADEVARGVLDARPSVTLRDGIRRMTAWAKRRGPTPPVVFRDIEVCKNLPPSWNV